MNNSLIVGIVVKFFAAIYSFFENSVFYRVQKLVKTLWCKITRDSFFTRWFSTPAQSCAIEQSITKRTFQFLISFAKKIIQPVYKGFTSSTIISGLNSWYDNFFVNSMRGYGLFLLVLSASYTLISLLKGNDNSLIIAFVAMGILGSLAVILNRSIGSILTNSSFVRWFMSILDISLEGISETKENSRAYLLWHILLALICGVTSAVLNNFFAPVILAGILCAGVFIKEYRVGLFSALILMPFLPTMAVVALVLLSFVLFIIRLCADENMKYVSTPLDGVLGIFALVMFISSIASFAMGNSVQIFLVYLAFVLSYYLTVNSVRTKKQLYALIGTMLFAGGIVALYGIYQHIFGFEGGATWTDTEMFEDIETRVISTFGNPNVLGEYLLLLIPVSISYVFAKKGVKTKTINLAITAMMSLCMIYTYSRGNWIGLIIAIALLFMFYDGRIVWLGIIAMFFVPMLLPQNVINRFLSVGDTTDSSTSYRVYIWNGTIAMLKDYWSCGIGLGTEAFNKIYPFYSFSGISAPHSHNLYLQIITENGVMGIVTFLALILTYYKMGISYIIKEKKDKVLKATVTGLCAGMFGYLVQGLFDNVWYNYRIVFMFYIILALTACGVLISDKGDKV